jgi:hypothetical protein
MAAPSSYDIKNELGGYTFGRKDGGDDDWDTLRNGIEAPIIGGEGESSVSGNDIFDVVDVCEGDGWRWIEVNSDGLEMTGNFEGHMIDRRQSQQIRRSLL